MKSERNMPELDTQLPFLVQQATQADLQAIVELREEAAAWMVEHGIDQWQPEGMQEEHYSHYVDSNELFVVKQQDTMIAALVCAESDEDIWGEMPPDALYVHSKMVALSHRGQGIGEQLLAWVQQRAEQHQKTFVRLDCAADNPKLIAYYARQGYKRVGIKQLPASLGGSTVALMQKPTLLKD